MTFRYCASCDKRGKAGNGIRTYTYKGQNVDLCYECAELMNRNLSSPVEQKEDLCES